MCMFPIHASEATDIRILVSRSPITLPNARLTSQLAAFNTHHAPPQHIGERDILVTGELPRWPLCDLTDDSAELWYWNSIPPRHSPTTVICDR